MRIERDNQLPGEKDREIINYPGVGLLRIERLSTTREWA